MSQNGLPNGFFDSLSPKKEALLQVLLEAEGEWVHGDNLRQQMRDEYGLSVPNHSGAISSHQGHFTRRYSKQFSRDVIDVQWIDDTKTHAEYCVGPKYENELRDHFNK